MENDNTFVKVGDTGVYKKVTAPEVTEKEKVTELLNREIKWAKEDAAKELKRLVEYLKKKADVLNDMGTAGYSVENELGYIKAYLRQYSKDIIQAEKIIFNNTRTLGLLAKV